MSPERRLTRVGGGDGVHLPVHVDAHFGEETVCEVVGEPALGPGEEGRQRGEYAKQN